MNQVSLVRKNLTRNGLRFALNLFAIFIAFFLFGALGSIKNAFDAGVELSAVDRLVVINKISFTQTMPVSYVNKIRTVEGVKKVTWANWFGGYYQDPKKMAMTFVVDGESYLDVYEDLISVDAATRQQWLSQRDSVIVGENLARTHGWQAGDRIPLSSNIFSHKEGGHTWNVLIAGVFGGGSVNTDTSYILMHHDYFFETQTFPGEWIGWLTLTTGDASLNESVSRAIDEQFANSSAETKTSTEAAFNKAFIEQIGDIGLMITSVVLAAFFTILMIVGNSMMLSIRERTREIAVMKTLGFSAPRVGGMVLAEALLLAGVGGGLGLCFAYFTVGGMSKVPQIATMFPNLRVDGDTVLNALVLMLMLGLLTGILPALRAFQLNTIDALSRG